MQIAQDESAECNDPVLCNGQIQSALFDLYNSIHNYMAFYKQLAPLLNIRNVQEKLSHTVLYYLWGMTQRLFGTLLAQSEVQ